LGEIIIVQQVPYEPAGALTELITQAGHSFRYIKPFSGDSIPSPNCINDYHALIILGGPMSVNDQAQLPFLKDEIILIQAALKEKKPLLGICLGAQLIAAASGQKIYPGTLEVGWGDIVLNQDHYKDDPLWSTFPHHLKVFHWHGETFDLPKDAIHLARSSQCPQQAFSLGGHAYGLQFHFEVTLEIVQNWIDYASDQGIDLSTDQKLAMVAETKRELPLLHHHLSYFMKGFLQLETQSST
jgi:GMP synthase (glutamine-hydrolysing)